MASNQPSHLMRQQQNIVVLRWFYCNLVDLLNHIDFLCTKESPILNRMRPIPKDNILQIQFSIIQKAFRNHSYFLLRAHILLSLYLTIFLSHCNTREIRNVLDPFINKKWPNSAWINCFDISSLWHPIQVFITESLEEVMGLDKARQMWLPVG